MNDRIPPEPANPGTGRSRYWPAGFRPHDRRAIAAHAWYQACDAAGLAEKPPEELRQSLAKMAPEELRRLLAEAIDHVRQLLDVSDEADRYEQDHEREGTHV